MQCVEVQLLEAPEQSDDEVLAATTVVDYPRSKVQPEDTSVDYTKLLMRVRDLAYPDLEGPLQLEDRNSIESPSAKRDLHFTSDHPAHPEALVYRFEPRLVEEGAVKYKLCVFAPEDGQDPPIREFLVDQTEKLDGFELGERYAEGMTVGEKRVEVSGKGDKAEMAEELVDIVLTVHEEALEAFENHPAFD